MYKLLCERLVVFYLIFLSYTIFVTFILIPAFLLPILVPVLHRYLQKKNNKRKIRGGFKMNAIF